MNWWRSWKKREGEIPNGKKQIPIKFQLSIFKIIILIGSDCFDPVRDQMFVDKF